VAACAAAGDEVIGLSRADADLTDAAAARRVVAEAAPEVVYHLAALASVAASWERPGDVLEVNLTTTLNVLEAVREGAPGARVVLAGSGEVYGPPARLPVDETAPLRPQNPYAASKAAAELLGSMYADAHGLGVIRARAFNHVGPGQSPTYVVASLTRQVAEGLLAEADPVRVVSGAPDTRRDFTDVRDVVDAYRLLADRAEPGVYNVCSGSAVSVAEILEALGRVTGRAIDHAVDPSLLREHDVMEVRGSHERLTAATGWQPRIPLERTLADTVEWWKTALSTQPRARGNPRL
jgi:GDP-4-dehydro-6-deoxy-D-mannose reductase